jgi:hypothetical protein
MGKSSAPPTPDYKGAAEQTAAGNRVNQVTPYGSLTYSAPSSGNSADPWTQTINLSPTGQQLLDMQNQTSLGLGALQNKGLMGVQGSMDNMPNINGLPARQVNPGQTAQDAILARMMPILDKQHDRLDNQLANQGITLGSDAYKTSQDQFGRQANDAISQAALQGIDVGQQARQQGMQEQNFYATEPLNILNALRTGSQVQNPTFGSTPAGANYMQAAQNTYGANLNGVNVNNANNAAFMNGLMQIGGLAAYASDFHIKQNIGRIGTHPRGFGIYAYEYKPEYRAAWGHGQHVGVIAQEVQRIIPEAVSVHRDGYLMVNYGAL